MRLVQAQVLEPANLRAQQDDDLRMCACVLGLLRISLIIIIHWLLLVDRRTRRVGGRRAISLGRYDLSAHLQRRRTGHARNSVQPTDRIRQLKPS